MSAHQSKLCLGIVMLLSSSGVMAQEAEDVIAECARIPSTGDRILCLEDALRQQSAASETAVTPDVDVEMQVAEEVSSEPVTAAVATVSAADPVSSGNESVTEEEAAATVQVAPQVELGAEQVARQNDVEEEQVRISAAIVEHALVGTGRLRLTLDNGQVWQQTGDDDDRIARRIRGQENIAVEMWQSRSGGYRMHLLEADRILRVRRIR